MHSIRGPPLPQSTVCSRGRFRPSITNPSGEKCTESCILGCINNALKGDIPKFSSPKFNQNPGRKLASTNLDLRKFVHQNVFIDSYYPTVLADKSQNSSDSAFYLNKSKGSQEEFQTFRRTRHSSFINSKPTKQDWVYPSSKSRTTIDSKTFTIYSQGSDWHRVCDTRSRGDYVGSRSRYFMEQPPDTCQGLREPQKSSPLLDTDPIECLHKRVETLEGLLKKALVNTPQRKIRSRRLKNQKGRKAWCAGDETSSENEEGKESEDYDTEHELLVIRKRLKDLERKLQTGSTSDYKSSRDSSSININATFEDEDFRKQRCYESSGTENFKISSELDYSSNCSLSSSREDLKPCRGKIFTKRPKEKKNFLKQCKILKKKQNKTSEPETHPSSNDILYKCSKVTKKGRTYCCYSFPPQKTNKDSLTKVVYVKCQKDEDLDIKPPKRRCGKKRPTIKDLSKKNSNTNILVLASREDQTKITELFLRDRSRKSRSENFDCDAHKKFSKREVKVCEKNNTKAQGEGNVRPQVTDKVWEACLKCNSGRWTCCPLCAPPPKEWSPRISTAAQAKSPQRGKLYRNPLEVLKLGGKIKIPVLFEELCRAPKEKRLQQKASNISMRLVFVKHDSKNPLNSLRKFIQKLSQSPHLKGPSRER